MDPSASQSIRNIPLWKKVDALLQYMCLEDPYQVRIFVERCGRRLTSSLKYGKTFEGELLLTGDTLAEIQKGQVFGSSSPLEDKVRWVFAAYAENKRALQKDRELTVTLSRFEALVRDIGLVGAQSPSSLQTFLGTRQSQNGLDAAGKEQEQPYPLRRQDSALVFLKAEKLCNRSDGQLNYEDFKVLLNELAARTFGTESAEKSLMLLMESYILPSVNSESEPQSILSDEEVFRVFQKHEEILQQVFEHYADLDSAIPSGEKTARERAAPLGIMDRGVKIDMLSEMSKNFEISPELISFRLIQNTVRSIKGKWAGSNMVGLIKFNEFVEYLARAAVLVVNNIEVEQSKKFGKLSTTLQKYLKLLKGESESQRGSPLLQTGSIAPLKASRYSLLEPSSVTPRGVTGRQSMPSLPLGAAEGGSMRSAFLSTGLLMMSRPHTSPYFQQPQTPRTKARKVLPAVHPEDVLSFIHGDTWSRSVGGGRERQMRSHEKIKVFLSFVRKRYTAARGTDRQVEFVLPREDDRPRRFDRASKESPRPGAGMTRSLRSLFVRFCDTETVDADFKNVVMGMSNFTRFCDEFGILGAHCIRQEVGYVFSKERLHILFVRYAKTRGRLAYSDFVELLSALAMDKEEKLSKLEALICPNIPDVGSSSRAALQKLFEAVIAPKVKSEFDSGVDLQGQLSQLLDDSEVRDVVNSNKPFLSHLFDAYSSGPQSSVNDNASASGADTERDRGSVRITLPQALSFLCEYSVVPQLLTRRLVSRVFRLIVNSPNTTSGNQSAAATTVASSRGKSGGDGQSSVNDSMKIDKFYSFIALIAVVATEMAYNPPASLYQKHNTVVEELMACAPKDITLPLYTGEGRKSDLSTSGLPRLDSDLFETRKEIMEKSKEQTETQQQEYFLEFKKLEREDTLLRHQIRMERREELERLVGLKPRRYGLDEKGIATLAKTQMRIAEHRKRNNYEQLAERDLVAALDSEEERLRNLGDPKGRGAAEMFRVLPQRSPRKPITAI